MPPSDGHEFIARVTARFEELPKMPTVRGPAATVLIGQDNGDADAKLREWKETRDLKALEIIREEGNAQWDRIIDRRANDWFHSIVVPLLTGTVGFLFGSLI